MIENFRDSLLNRQMTRKEFVKYMLGMALAIFGVHNFLSYLRQTHPSTVRQETANDDQRGFGTRKFGV